MLDIPASKKLAQEYDRIETILSNKASGYTRNELLVALGWQGTNANKQKLKRMLETLRLDPSSDVVAVKQNQTFGASDELPVGKHHITWKLQKNVLNKKEIEAITLVTAKKYAALFLPPNQREWLDARYKDLYLKQASLRSYSAWHEKIRIEPRYPPIFPKQQKNYDEVEKVIFNALMDNTSFKARYDFSEEEKIFYPVRLIQREQVLYVLCAHTQHEPAFKEYAFHRLMNVTENKDELDTAYTKSDYIDDHRVSGVLGPWKKIEEIKIRITGPARFHFTEMRFHASESLAHLTNVTFEDDDFDDGSDFNSVVLSIKNVAYTYEFRTWLLGFGSCLEILSPQALREDIMSEISEMMKKYNK